MTNQFCFKLNPEEKIEIEKTAKLAGLSIGSFVRFATLKYLRNFKKNELDQRDDTSN